MYIHTEFNDEPQISPLFAFCVAPYNHKGHTLKSDCKRNSLVLGFWVGARVVIRVALKSEHRANFGENVYIKLLKKRLTIK